MAPVSREGTLVAAEAAGSAETDKEQEGCDSSVPVLPMPDEDPTVWEDALAMTYPWA